MKNTNPLIIFLFLFTCLAIVKETNGNFKKDNHLLKIWCTSPDSAGAITGRNFVCYGDTATYSVPTIALATGYNWTLPSGAKIISGANTNSITAVFKGSSGNISVYGTNTCLPGKASSIFVTVNPLPKLSLIAPQKYCCDYGNISMGNSNFATPVGGNWSCRQNPSYINSNTFLTSQACNPTKPVIFSLLYIYQDPTTGCINKDSTKLTINPLPAIKFEGETLCQSKEKIRLKPYIKAPINLNTMVDVKFRLLKTVPKVGGGNCKITDLISDEDVTLNFDFWLTVSKNVIDLGSDFKDSIILELTIQAGTGCYNKDTATFILVNDPEITFDGFPELCINAGKVNLTKISNTKPVNGCWKAIDTSGFNSKSVLQTGMIGCDTLNTLKLNLQNGPGLYWMRYTHTSSGCYVKRDTFLRINSMPNVKIGLSPPGIKGKYCENDPEVTLNATPANGIWMSSMPGVIADNKFKPSLVPSSERDKWISLTYTYTHPTTKCDTAKSVMVFVQSKPKVDIITPDIDTCWRKLSNFKLTANYSFTSKITWFHNFNPLKASFDNNYQYTSNNPANYSISPTKGSTTFVLITLVSESEGVCPIALDSIKIKINPDSCIGSMVGISTKYSNKPFDFSIFPNPNKGKFGIEINKDGNYSFKLYSVDGKLILEKNIEGLRLESINKQLSKGSYNAVIEDLDGNLIKKKMMVE